MLEQRTTYIVFSGDPEEWHSRILCVLAVRTPEEAAQALGCKLGEIWVSPLGLERRWALLVDNEKFILVTTPEDEGEFGVDSRIYMPQVFIDAGMQAPEVAMTMGGTGFYLVEVPLLPVVPPVMITPVRWTRIAG